LAPPPKVQFFKRTMGLSRKPLHFRERYRFAYELIRGFGSST
jgi:hypothetical protein